MRLSEISTDRALDVLCEVSVYIGNIATDEALTDELKKHMNTSGMSKAEIMKAGAEKISAIAPIVLKSHKNDVLGILAAVNEKTVDELKQQNVMNTMKMVKELVQDEEFISFFSSCAQEKKM